MSKLANDIATARRAFSDGVRQHDPASVHKERMEALTDLLWANLDEIVAALRFSPGDWVNLQRRAAAQDDARDRADAQTLRYCANTCSVTTHIRGRLREIAERLEPKPTIEDLERVGERLVS